MELQEAKQQIIKRKYTDLYPAMSGQIKTPVRNKILAYIYENSPVSKEDLNEFLAQFRESTGRQTTMRWVKYNIGRYIKETVNKHKTTYSLTKNGVRILARTQINEHISNTYKNIINEMETKDRENTIDLIYGTGVTSNEDIVRLASMLNVTKSAIVSKIKETDEWLNDSFIDTY